MRCAGATCFIDTDLEGWAKATRFPAKCGKCRSNHRLGANHCLLVQNRVFSVTYLTWCEYKGIAGVRGRTMESNIRYYARRAAQERVAARNAVTSEARDRRLALAEKFQAKVIELTA